MAVLVDTADGVVTALAAATSLSQQIKPVRSFAQWQTKFDVLEADGLKVDCVPVSRLDAGLGTKRSIAWSPRTDIVVRKKFPESDISEADGAVRNESVDPLVQLVEEIYAALVALRVRSDSLAVWTDEQILAAYMPSHLRDRHQFTGVIRVTHGICSSLS